MPIIYTRICNWCKIEYSGRGKLYCSNACATKFKHSIGIMKYERTSKFKPIPCPVCKKLFKQKRTKDKYCSPDCYYKSISRRFKLSGHPNWKGGKSRTSNGYVQVCIGAGKRVLEHRLVMENHLKRKLQRKEHVHHINGIKTDNRIENLVVLSTNEHNKLHAKAQWEENGSLRSIYK